MRKTCSRKTSKRQLLGQIEAVYEVWARDGLNAESTSRMLNGLFDLAKNVNRRGMEAAFSRGVEAEDARVKRHFLAR
jgi:hypothetical protein